MLAVFSAVFLLAGLTLVWAQSPPPLDPNALPVNNNDGEVNLVWTPNPSASPTPYAYNIYRVLQYGVNITPTCSPTGPVTPCATATPIATVLASSGTAYQDLQVTNGRTYVYSVSGLNPTEGAAVPVTVVPFAPPAFIPVQVQNLHQDALDLSWAVPPSTFPIYYYAVYSYEYPGPGTPPAAVPVPTVMAAVTPVTLYSPANSYTDMTYFNQLFPTPLYSPTNTSTPASSQTPTPTPTVPSFYYVVVAYDDQQTPQMGQVQPPTGTTTPYFSTNAAVPEGLPPDSPVLSGSLPQTTTTVLPSPTAYGVTLYWNGALASEGVTYYQLLRNGAPITTVLITPTPKPTYSYYDPNIPLSANVTYAGQAPTTYQLIAENNNGPATSNTLQESVYGAYLPSIQVTPNTTPNGVTITWSQATPGLYGLNGYLIFKSSSGFPTPGNITPTPIATQLVTPYPTATYCYIDTQSFNAQQTPDANNMTYWVAPYDSVTVDGPAQAAPLALAPTPVGSISAASAGSNNQITITWSPGGPGFYGPIQDYAVYREMITPNATPTPTCVANVPASQTSYTDSVDSQAGTVAYQVAAKDYLGNSAPLSLVPLSNGIPLSQLTAPGTPQVVSMLGNSATLEFMVANPQGDAVTSYAFFNTPPPSTPVATETPAPSATEVCYSVIATPWAVSLNYATAQNGFSQGQPATLAGILPSGYQVYAAVPTPTQQIDVYWTMVPTPQATPPINFYEVYRAMTPGNNNFTPIATVPISAPGYVDNQVSAGTKYYYRISAIANSGGITAQSPIDFMPTPSTTPIQACLVTWPNPPTMVVSSGVSLSTLYWSSNAALEGVTGYSVTENGTPVTIIPATPNATPTPGATIAANYAVTIQDTPGAISTYQVVAQNAQGMSNPSAVTVLMVPTVTVVVALTPPLGFTPTPGATPAYPQVVWMSGFAYSTNISDYVIYRSTAPSCPPALMPWSSVAGTVYNPTSIFADSSPMTGYINYYQAVPNNGAGVTANPAYVPVEAINVWPLPPVLPSVPYLTGTSSSVSLSWAVTGTTNIANYSVYRSAYPNITPTIIATVTAQPTPSFYSNYTDSNVTTGGSYVYWVDAAGSGGNSGLSQPQSFMPVQAPPSLAITPLAGKNLLYWSPVTPVPTSLMTGYVVYRAFVPTPGQTPAFSQVGSIVDGLSNTVFADTTVSEATTYIYEVLPSTQNGIVGPASSPATQGVYPHPVSDLLAASGDGIVQLRWLNQGVTTTTYTIQRKLGTAPNSAYQVLATGVQGVNYTDQGLQDKTFYNYQVISVDTSGLSAISRPVLALPAATPIIPQVVSNGVTINAPVSVSQSQSSIGQGNTLSWPPADPNGINPLTMYPLGGYSVYSSPDGITYQWLADVPANQTSYFDQEQLINGGDHTYLVQAFDSPPNLPVTSVSQAVSEGLVHTNSYSPTVAYTVPEGGALDRNSIRPFGTANEQAVHIRIAVTAPGNVDIKVYTLNGTFVRELVNSYFGVGIYGLPGGLRPISWDGRNAIGNLVASGVYLITVEMNGHQEIDKVAVIK